MNKVDMVKRIMGLSIALLLTLGLVVGGTFAYLADPENSTSNSLLAGTMDMVPSTVGTGPVGKYSVTAGGNPDVNGFVTFSKLRPGDSGTITWVLSNDGTVAGTLTISSTVSFSENGSNVVETAVSGNNGGGNGDLDQYMGIKLQRGIGTDQTNAESNFTYLLGDGSNYGAFTSLESILDAESQAMAASGGNDTIVYRISWALANPLGIGINPSIIQSDTAQIDANFTLTQ